MNPPTIQSTVATGATLLVVRHGESEWNAAGRWQGWGDPPLSFAGRRQAEGAGQGLAGRFDAVVSSDLWRAVETAQVLSDMLDIGEVRVDARLRERDIGTWTGMTSAEIEAGSPGSIAAWQGGELDRPGGGETIAEFSDRVGEALNDLGLNQAGKTVLVCAHGGVVRYLDRIAGRPRPGPAAHLNGYWVNVRPPSIAVGQGFSPGRALESVTWQYR